MGGAALTHRSTVIAVITIAMSLLASSVVRVEPQGRSHAARGPRNPSDQQVTGAYDVVPDWPKPLSSWPGHEGWTWGATQGVFAQNPDRVFVIQRGELRELRPDPARQTITADLGTRGPVLLTVPVVRQFARNASVDPTGSPGEPAVPLAGVDGRDYRWEHLINIFDREGNLVESWTQWDKLIGRPHKIRISPYDAEKRVWLIDDWNHAIYVFSNDGTQLLQTIGTRGEKGEDDRHFGRATDIAWLPDGTFFVSDGYENTRVVKFDKHGRLLTAWGHQRPSGAARVRLRAPNCQTGCRKMDRPLGALDGRTNGHAHIVSRQP